MRSRSCICQFARRTQVPIKSCQKFSQHKKNCLYQMPCEEDFIQFSLYFLQYVMAEHAGKLHCGCICKAIGNYNATGIGFRSPRAISLVRSIKIKLNRGIRALFSLSWFRKDQNWIMKPSAPRAFGAGVAWMAVPNLYSVVKKATGSLITHHSIAERFFKGMHCPSLSLSCCEHRPVAP